MTVDNFTAEAVANFFPRTCCVKHQQHNKREPGLFKEELRCTKMLCLCINTYCCYDVPSNKLKFGSEGLNKGVFKEAFRCTEMLCLCSKTYCCCDFTFKKIKFISRGLNKRVLEQSGDGPLEKYRRVLNEKLNVTSNNRGFRTINHSVASYEQIKKSLSKFYPKRKDESDGIHTRPLYF